MTLCDATYGCEKMTIEDRRLTTRLVHDGYHTDIGVFIFACFKERGSLSSHDPGPYKTH